MRLPQNTLNPECRHVESIFNEQVIAGLHYYTRTDAIYIGKGCPCAGQSHIKPVVFLMCLTKKPLLDCLRCHELEYVLLEKSRC